MPLLPNKIEIKISFEKMYNEYYSKVLRHIVKKIGNFHDAEDVASEVFIYCYQHFDSYDQSKASLGTWLYLVSESRIKNYYRSRRQNVSIDTLEEKADDGFVGPEKVAEFEESRRWLAEELKRLPELQRKIIVLRYFYDLKSQEIADEVGISNANVRTILSRTLDKLERNYKKSFIKGDKNG